MIYPTRRGVALVGLGIPAALICGVIQPRLWLAGVAWMAFASVAMVLDAALGALGARKEISTALPRGMAIGRGSVARFSVRFGGFSAPKWTETRLDVGPPLRTPTGRATVRVVKQIATAEFPLTAERRGEGSLERLWLRWTGPWRLMWLQSVEALDRRIPVVVDIEGVKEMAARLFDRDTRPGAHVQQSIADGSEFHALKAFESGMDRRTIDWKQSARHGLLLAKEFHAENNLQIVFALDLGRLMSEPLDGEPRLDRAIRAALLLSYVALKLGDRVRLFAFDDRPRVRSGAVSGFAAFVQIQALAAQVEYSTAETNYTLGLTQLASDLNHRSIVVVFSDFVDAAGAELMLENIGRLLSRHVVLFVLFRDMELEEMAARRPAEPEDVSRAVVADTLLRDRDTVVEKLKRLGVDVLDVLPGQIGMGLLERYLEAKRKGRV